MVNRGLWLVLIMTGAFQTGCAGLYRAPISASQYSITSAEPQVCSVRFFEPDAVVEGCGCVLDSKTVIVAAHQLRDNRPGLVEIDGHQTRYIVEEWRPADEVAILSLDEPLPNTYSPVRRGLDRRVAPGTELRIASLQPDERRPATSAALSFTDSTLARSGPAEPYNLTVRTERIRYQEYPRGLVILSNREQAVRPGMSGSPALIREGDEWTVVGVVSRIDPHRDGRVRTLIAR